MRPIRPMRLNGFLKRAFLFFCLVFFFVATGKEKILQAEVVEEIYFIVNGEVITKMDFEMHFNKSKTES